MHERSVIEKALKREAVRLSARYGNAPVVIILGGSKGEKISRTMTASLIKNGRLRDLVGILQTAIQIETLKHFDLMSE
jgi:UDP-N-acetylglucosamine:LPS N-acetylglucosamine transferase